MIVYYRPTVAGPALSIRRAASLLMTAVAPDAVAALAPTRTILLTGGAALPTAAPSWWADARCRRDTFAAEAARNTAAARNDFFATRRRPTRCERAAQQIARAGRLRRRA